jgi:hypothetical protein
VSIIIYVIVLMMTMLILEGQAGGNRYANKGGGSNYLCLPNDPDNGKPLSYANDVLYGVEYESPIVPTGFPNLRQKEASCAVCRRKGKSSTLMIPGIRYSFKYILYNKIMSAMCQCSKGLSDILNKTPRNNFILHWFYLRSQTALTGYFFGIYRH